MLESDEKFGFIVMDGNGVLIGSLCGNTREVLHKMSVDLPKKHGRGGQSAVRFARLRLEKRHNYLRKVAELATQYFITNDRVCVYVDISISLAHVIILNFLFLGMIAQCVGSHSGRECRF